MHYLLDKNIIRHAITALRDARKRPLLPLELGALSFWQAARRRCVRLFISLPSYHVLQRRRHYKEALIFLKFSEVLSPARNHTRWARRIRETSKLSREDSAYTIGPSPKALWGMLVMKFVMANNNATIANLIMCFIFHLLILWWGAWRLPLNRGLSFLRDQPS